MTLFAYILNCSEKKVLIRLKVLSGENFKFQSRSSASLKTRDAKIASYEKTELLEVRLQSPRKLLSVSQPIWKGLLVWFQAQAKFLLMK